MTQRGTQPRVSISLRLCVPAVLAALLLIVRQECAADIVIDLTYIGAAGNSSDTTGYGSVSYDYYIGTYEVTVAQYTEFLNAAAKSDPYGLYDESMGNGGGLSIPIIARSGEEGAYTYTAVSGREDEPVRFVDYYDGLRFCNWLNNGQGNADTETGSYDMALGLWVERGTNASWVLPSEDEWYKAAYYDPVNDVYYDYPNGSDAVPQEPTDETTPREMNFGDDPYWHGGGTSFTAIGETTGRTAFGVSDMGGNVTEWNESLVNPVQGPQRVTRGGFFMDHADDLSSAASIGYLPTVDGDGIGFRVAYIIPEPSTGVLLVAGLCLMLTRYRRRRG